MDGAALREFEVELDRIVDRLNAMPLGRVESAADECHAVADYLLARTRELTGDIPDDAVLPRVGPQAVGAQLAVIGRDYLTAMASAPVTDVRPALYQLVALRRSLP